MPRLAGYAEAGIAAGRPLAVAARAMVVAPSAWAASIGVETLRSGGNAVDAAVAVGAALAVAQPHQCGLGGDGFWLIRPRDGAIHALNASGRAPAAAAPGDLRDRGLDAIPPTSAWAVTVPGMVAGWRDAHARFGRRPFDALLAPAIEAAERGLAVTPHLARAIGHSSDVLRARAESARVLLSGGRAPAVGTVLRQPDLAGTLRALATAPDDLYTGRLAEAVAAAVRAEGGWLDAADLAAHRSDWVEPVTAPFAGWDVAEMPPNTQGITALMGLTLLADSGLRAEDPPAAWADAQISAARVFTAIRDREIADPASMRRTVAELLDPAFLRDARTSGPPGGGTRATGDTAHFAIVDEDGLAVSCIQSVFHAFGCGIVVPGTGIVLHCRGTSFSLDERHVNALRPGRRPMHTLAPAMALRGSRTAAVFGCMGGSAQTQIHLQLVSALAGRGEDPVAAVSAPRWALAGEKVLAEDRDGLPGALEAAGHAVTRLAPFAPAGVGHAQVIVADDESGVLAGAADPRSDGAALGY